MHKFLGSAAKDIFLCCWSKWFLKKKLGAQTFVYYFLFGSRRFADATRKQFKRLMRETWWLVHKNKEKRFFFFSKKIRSPYSFFFFHDDKVDETSCKSILRFNSCTWEIRSTCTTLPKASFFFLQESRSFQSFLQKRPFYWMETFVVINATKEERNPTFYNHFFSCTRLGKSHIDACPTSDKCYHFSSEYTICYYHHHLKPHGAPC